MKDTSSSDFKKDILENDKPVLLDVWAPWCGPCRGMEPVLEQFTEEVSDWAEVYKLNADDNMQLVQELGVSGLPTYIAFNAGEKIASTVGATSKASLLDLVEKARA